MDFSQSQPPLRPDSCYRLDARLNPSPSFLNEAHPQPQPLGPSHHHPTNSTSSKAMQSYSPTITDDLYSFDQLSIFSPSAPALEYFPHQQHQQSSHQMHHQRQLSLQQHQHQQAQQAQSSLMLPSVPSISNLGQQQQHQHQQQQQQQFHLQASLHYQPQATYELPQNYEFVQRHAPSSRAYAYHPYASSPTIADARLSGYGAWDLQTHALPQQQLHPGIVDFQDYNQYPSHAHNGTVHPAQLLGCADPHSFSSPTTTTYDNNTQPQFHCIAPEELFSPQPLTPISPYQSSKDEDSSDRSSSPGTSSGSSGRSSPTSTPLHRLAINTNVPTAVERQREAAAVSAATNAGWAHHASPVDSLSSQDSGDDRETTFIPPASVKKAVVPSKAKRATRSAPEPAWVEAVLAEDAKRLQDGLNGAVAAGKPANRPIAFACVFCRHRKIQCIRPKTETAPGEKPAPCNQCEKRNRCCEYPPAALNPRIGRRTKERSSISKGNNED